MHISTKARFLSILFAVGILLAGPRAAVHAIPFSAFIQELSLGDRGAAVAGLQTFLASIPGVYPEGSVTGYYGPLTKQAVARFQSANGIVAVGRVGPLTLVKLKQIAAGLPAAGNASVLALPAPEIQLAPAAGSEPASPLRLKIPSIGVNAAVEHLGLTAGGNMDMTASLKNVAWYNLGPKPGQAGSAVIGGHWGGGKAVFGGLSQLKSGDTVEVVDAAGQTRTFRVKGAKMYGATESVPEVFYSADGKSYLNIITCQGEWIPSLKTYDRRLVVFTELVS